MILPPGQRQAGCQAAVLPRLLCRNMRMPAGWGMVSSGALTTERDSHGRCTTCIVQHVIEEHLHVIVFQCASAHHLLASGGACTCTGGRYQLQCGRQVARVKGLVNQLVCESTWVCGQGNQAVTAVHAVITRLLLGGVPAAAAACCSSSLTAGLAVPTSSWLTGPRARHLHAWDLCTGPSSEQENQSSYKAGRHTCTSTGGRTNLPFSEQLRRSKVQTPTSDSKSEDHKSGTCFSEPAHLGSTS